jgi:hypothetical protein
MSLVVLYFKACSISLIISYIVIRSGSFGQVSFFLRRLRGIRMFLSVPKGGFIQTSESKSSWPGFCGKKVR